MEKVQPDPHLKKYYEDNPFDPLAGARIMGKFLGSLLTFDRKMNPFVFVGSIVIGLMFLVPGLINGNVFSLTLGVGILANVARNIKRS